MACAVKERQAENSVHLLGPALVATTPVSTFQASPPSLGRSMLTPHFSSAKVVPDVSRGSRMSPPPDMQTEPRRPSPTSCKVCRCPSPANTSTESSTVAEMLSSTSSRGDSHLARQEGQNGHAGLSRRLSTANLRRASIAQLLDIDGQEPEHIHQTIHDLPEEHQKQLIVVVQEFHIQKSFKSKSNHLMMACLGRWDGYEYIYDFLCLKLDHCKP
jgi:hypothetical protein